MTEQKKAAYDQYGAAGDQWWTASLSGFGEALMGENSGLNIF